jgi:hypothetical protein
MVRMTNVDVARNRQRRWLGIGLGALVLGVVSFAAAVPLASLAVTGWPWHASITEQADQGQAEIALENGHVETFTGTPAEARAWLDARQAALRDQYGIPTKVAVGNAFAVASGVLILFGGGVMLWRFGAFVAARRTRSVTAAALSGGSTSR